MYIVFMVHLTKGRGDGGWHTCGNVASYKLPGKKTPIHCGRLNRFSFRTTPVHRLHFVFYTHTQIHTTKRKLKYIYLYISISFCFLTIPGHTARQRVDDNYYYSYSGILHANTYIIIYIIIIFYSKRGC